MLNQNQLCPICLFSGFSNIHLHTLSYLRCRKCEHVFANSSKSSIDKLKDASDKRLFLQKNDVALKEYQKRSSIIDQIIFPQMRSRSKVLKSYSQYGLIENKMSSLGFSVNGLEYRKTFQPNSKIIIGRKIGCINSGLDYDYIILDSYLEYQYCPYLAIAESLSLIKERGTIFLMVPLNNSPISNLQFRSHEFTKNSLSFFLNTIDLEYKNQEIDGISICSITVH